MQEHNQRSQCNLALSEPSSPALATQTHMKSKILKLYLMRMTKVFSEHKNNPFQETQAKR